MRTSHPTRWQEVADVLGPLLFQWSSGCIEQNIIPAVPVDKLEALLTHTDDDHITNMRLRTLADRVGIGDKSFAALSSTATDLHTVMVEAAIGYVPPDKKEIKSERKNVRKTRPTLVQVKRRRSRTRSQALRSGGMATVCRPAFTVLQRCAFLNRLTSDHGSFVVSDETVRRALRSRARLVVIEAPAGCGKNP